MDTTNSRTDSATAQLMEQILYEVKRVVVGQDRFLERVMVAMLAQGHLLVEGVPGLAKTLTVKTLASTIQGSFKRIQFTPDLVPADLVGTRIYNQKTGDFSTSLGPVFANLLLADEINRAPAKVQSALLEVMQERQVTIGGETHPLPSPFLVLATQNPIEHEGTYQLPEAQLDRLMMKILVGYPGRAAERQMLDRLLEIGPEATGEAGSPVLSSHCAAESPDASTRSTVWTMSWRNREACTAVARPTVAITAGSRARVIWKARARVWLKPSAARKRWKESLASWPQPVRRSVRRASSPSSS